MNDTIANRLKSLRVEHEISQLKLAEKLGISNSTVARAESGRAIPDTYVIMKYAEHFCVSTDWILFGREYE
jgi:transcriptional regulator with XRE-family HTH domain